MARYRGSVCRLCRRENARLFLKGDRCYSEKCAIDRRNYPPGQHGQLRPKFSEYGVQLREKQKVKRVYGLMEDQFRSYFHRADRMKGITGENLLQLLERRLDNVAYRLGFASSRNEARQLVRHGHVVVNGRKVNVPSYLTRTGDVVEVRDGSRKLTRVQAALESVVRRGVPSWLELDRDAFRGKIRELPKRDDLSTPEIHERLIVELYSK